MDIEELEKGVKQSIAGVNVSCLTDDNSILMVVLLGRDREGESDAGEPC